VTLSLGQRRYCRSARVGGKDPRLPGKAERERTDAAEEIGDGLGTTAASIT
jgi:hypothetical protein